MFEEIVGSSKPMRQVVKQVEKVAPSDSTVLILGETGTGKELIARALHRQVETRKPSLRPRQLRGDSAIADCVRAFRTREGSLHRRIATAAWEGLKPLTGARSSWMKSANSRWKRRSRFCAYCRSANSSGWGAIIRSKVDVRLIAATNRDLPAAVAAGTFRQDLFYRLNVFPIAVPPLRERAEDIPLLVEYFVGRYAKGCRQEPSGISASTRWSS